MHQRLDIGDMRQGQDGAAIELLIMRHVTGNNREAQVNTPKKCLNFNYFRYVPRGFDKRRAQVAGVTPALSARSAVPSVGAC